MATPGVQSKSQAQSKNKLPLDEKLLLKIHNLMVKSRALEERLIKIYKSGDAFFWIGGPGEEAFGVPLGLLVNKGQGPEYDWLHLHYRCSPTLVAMGMPLIDSIRLIMNRATDVSTGGRNFANHYCYPEWNVAPVTSPIEVQYSIAVGTAHVQSRSSGNGVTIVTGGDAGSAEGDFASCLIWSTRPKKELPMLITVQNNGWGISTNYESQHGESSIAQRGVAFGMKTMKINGNDPVESYLKIQEALEYIRKNKKPILMEAMVSRLYGHSSADGANKRDVPCCLEEFEKKLLNWGIITRSEIDQIKSQYESEAQQAMIQARTEPAPLGNTIWDHVYFKNENANWREF